jgi:hypothetical protein
MGTFLDLFTPDPKMIVQNAKNVFKPRNGKPFVQSVARNLGHISFGENAGNWVDTNILGDNKPVGSQPLNTDPMLSMQPLSSLSFNKNQLQQQLQQYFQRQGLK